MLNILRLLLKQKGMFVINILDRHTMEMFAKKYGLKWSQVKTRIMNEKKAKRAMLQRLKEEMGLSNS